MCFCRYKCTRVIPEKFLKDLAPKYNVSELELEVLLLAIDGKSITEIARTKKISDDAVRKRLGEVYKKFQIKGTGTGKLAKLQQTLSKLYREKQFELSEYENVNHQQRQDWDEAPDVVNFYGRTTELAMLNQWIVQESCRLIALVGMGGIGKTALSVKLGKQIQDKFDFLVWRSLHNAPTVTELLTDLIRFLSPQQRLSLPEDLDSLISQLINHLNKHRCLLVLDNVESILISGDFAGYYPEEHKDYGKLLKRLGEELHNSCLLLVGQEKPREIPLLEGDRLPVRSFQLTGLQEKEARRILEFQGLSGEDKWGVLINIYRGNPLALKIVAMNIQDSFGGSVTEFIAQGRTYVFRDIRDLIDQQFNRLSNLEKEIIYWIAIEDPVSLSILREKRKNSSLPMDQLELPEALGSLYRRSLIERNKEDASSFELQPVIKQYVTSRLIEQVYEEIYSVMKTEKATERIKKFDILRSHTLVKGEAVNKILIPVKNKLLAHFRSKEVVEDQLTRIQTLLQGKDRLEFGYSEENMLGLLTELKTDSSAQEKI